MFCMPVSPSVRLSVCLPLNLSLSLSKYNVQYHAFARDRTWYYVMRLKHILGLPTGNTLYQI